MMTVFEYIVFLIVIILANCLSLWLYNFSAKKGGNAADLEDTQELNYLKEKGRNIATKEDIAEITKHVEEVKNAVSFQNQWEKEHILQREQRLIRILYLAQKICMSYNHILLMASNSHQVDKLLNLIKTLNEEALEITHEGNLLLVHYHNQKDIQTATNLVDTAVKYAAELSCLANNISVKMLGAEELKRQANENYVASSVKIMQNALQLVTEARDLSEQPQKYKQSTIDAINKYVLWLEKLYGEGVLIRYNMNDGPDDDK